MRSGWIRQSMFPIECCSCKKKPFAPSVMYQSRSARFPRRGFCDALWSGVQCFYALPTVPTGSVHKYSPWPLHPIDNRDVIIRRYINVVRIYLFHNSQRNAALPGRLPFSSGEGLFLTSGSLNDSAVCILFLGGDAVVRLALESS